MTSVQKYFFLFAVCAFTCLGACKDRWEEHNAVTASALTENLLQPIQQNPDLSRFAGFLAETGYDELLKSTKLYTVWAPSNEALNTMDPALFENKEWLSQFVANHISNQEYYSYTAHPNQRIRALSGKFLTWDRANSTIDGAGVVTRDQQYKNGVFHVINRPMVPLQNTYEFLRASTVGSLQKRFIIDTLTFNFFDPALAEQVGVNPTTGAPIYKPGTGIISRNQFLEQARDIQSEDSISTFFILTDAAYERELAKLKPFFVTATQNQDSTNRLAAWRLVRDFGIKGLILPEQLPAFVVSPYGTRVPVDRSAIVSSHRTSNGIVYVMNRMDFALAEKFPPIVIEGESAVLNRDFSRNDKNVNIHYRYRTGASNNFDIRVFEHAMNATGFWIRYTVRNVPTAKYQFFWRAVKDFGVEPLTQQLALHNPTQDTTFAYVTSPMNHRAEVPLGQYTVSRYGHIDLYVKSNKVSGNDLNPIVLDYIKMVPVLE